MKNKQLLQMLAAARPDRFQKFLDLTAVLRYQRGAFEQDLVAINQELWTLPHINELKLFPSYQLCTDMSVPLAPRLLKVCVQGDQLHYELLNLEGRGMCGSEKLGNLDLKKTDLTSLESTERLALLKALMKMIIKREGVYKLQPEEERLIREMLSAHPNLRSLGLGPGSPISSDHFQLQLVANFADFTTQKPRLSSEFLLTKFVSWLERKAIHAIRGGRPTEIGYLFDKSIELHTIYHGVLGVLEDNLSKAEEKDLLTQQAYQVIIDKNRQADYPPLACRDVARQHEQWMASQVATQHLETWNLFSIQRIHELKERKQEFSEKLINLQAAIAQRTESIADYTAIELGEEVADWLIQEFKDVNEAQVDQGTLIKIHKIVSFSPNQRLFSGGENEMSLRLAMRLNQLETFRALLDKGADIFGDREFLLELFSGSEAVRPFEQAVVNYLQDALTAKDSLSQRLFPRCYRDGSDEQLKYIKDMLIVVIKYLTDGFQVRLHRSEFEKFIHQVSGKDMLRWVTGTSTTQRLEQILSVIDLMQQADQSASDLGYNLAKSIRSVRTGIFSKRKQDHFVTRLDSLAQKLILESTVYDQRKEQAELAAESLREEERQRYAAEERYQKEREIQQRREQSRSRLFAERLAQQNKQIQAEETKWKINHFHVLREFSSREQVAGLGIPYLNEQYDDALRYLHCVWNFEEEKKPFDRLPHLDTQLVEAAALAGEQDNPAVTIFGI